MRKIIFIILLLPAISLAQFNVNGPGNLNYEKVFQADLAKLEIKTSVSEWIAKNYNDPKEVIVMDTEDKVIISPLFKINPVFNGIPVPMNVKYTLTSEFKEGRYKLSVDHITLNGSPVVNAPIPDYEQYKIEVEKSMSSMPKDAQKHMAKLLKDEEKSMKLYNETVGNQKKIMDLIKDHIQTRIVEDLTVFVENYNTESDW